MKKIVWYLILIILGLGLVLLLGDYKKTTKINNFTECVGAGNPVMESFPRQCLAGGQIFTEEITQPATSPTQMANPASVKCVQDGGELEIRESDRGQYGVCVFNDGRECEEWAYFRGECPAIK